MSNRIGRMSRMWTNIKKSLVFSRTKDTYVGSDEHGNKYFQRPENASVLLVDAAYNIKSVRRVEPSDPDQFKVPTIPVEWMTWLQGRRQDPPTREERDALKANALKIQARVDELEKKRLEDETNKSDISLPAATQAVSTKFPKYTDYEITPGESVKDNEEKDRR